MEKTVVINILPLHKIFGYEHVANYIEYLCNNYGFYENSCFIVGEETSKHLNKEIYHKKISMNSITSIKRKYKTEEEYALHVCYENDGILLNEYEEIIKDIINDNRDVVCIYTVYENYSLLTLSQRRNIPFRFIEQSAIRTNNYFENTLMWFLETPVIASGEHGKKRYDQFQLDIDKCVLDIPLSREELLIILSKNDDYKLFETIASKEDKNIGVACSVNYKEFCGSWNNERLISETCNFFGIEKVLCREHPASKENCLSHSVRIDDSQDSIEFIKKCSTVVSAGSNISYEAMLLGKNVIEMGDLIYSSKLSSGFGKDDHMYDDWFLNFITFCAYVPLERLHDIEYIEWRVNDKPSEMQIYNNNLMYILNKQYSTSILEKLNNPNENREMLLWYGAKIEPTKYRWVNDRAKWEKLLNESYDNKDVYLCGTGIDSELYLRLFTQLGIEIKGFVELDKDNKKKMFGKNIYGLKQIQLFDMTKCIFVFTQRNYYYRYKIKKILSENGAENFIEI